jgi:lysophospholipase L1-like esterase
VLGDSFTFALGVRFEDLYAQQLERRLNAAHTPRRFQVINAGVAGYNTRQELIYLTSEGLSLEPDLVVVGFYWNDLVGNEAPLPDAATTPKIAADQEQTEHAHFLPAWIRDPLRQSLAIYLGVQAVKNAWNLVRPPQNEYVTVQEALLGGDRDTLEPYWNATAQRLREIAQAARERGVPVILLAFPMENQLLRRYPELVWGERLREIWAPTGFALVDLEPAYRHERESGRNPFLPYDLHPNPHGMEVASDALYRAIRERGYLGLERPAAGD